MQYPLGVQNFSKIIKRGALYVDKTALLLDLVQQKEMVFLSRPRRFGKSLLISTLAALFSGQKDLFEGLAVSQTNYAFPAYPVIELSFARVAVSHAADFKQFIVNTTNSYAKRFNIELTIDEYEQRFAELIENLPDRVVLLIDEYDQPILDNLNADVLGDITKTMSSFYKSIKALDKYLEFVFITGVSKFAKVSVFSAMNNLVDISMDQHYATLCGITQSELEHQFSAGIAELAEIDQVDRQTIQGKIKQWYNGYRFHPAVETVYNPFSLLSLFTYKEFKYYWFATGTPRFLIEQIKKRQFDVSKIAKMEVDEGAFLSHEPEKIAPLSLLWQTGYLTIVKYDNGWYRLDFPNFEVKHAFNRTIVEYFANTDDTKNSHYLRDLCQALEQNDVDLFMQILPVFFANIPYDIQLSYEHYYHSLFHAIFTLMGYQIDSEVSTNNGRIDCVLQTNSTIYVIEFKLNDSKEAAIKQIEDKQYALKYQNSGKAIILLGVEFCQKSRNISGYLCKNVLANTFYEVKTVNPSKQNSLNSEIDLTETGNKHPSESLKVAIKNTIEHPAINKQPLVDLSAMPIISGKIVGREKEIEQLNQAWADDNIRVISFIAWGGVGKSSLINTWLNQMSETGFNGAERVFAHSFYSQGTGDQRQVSAAHFLNHAFSFLQYEGERPSSLHDQGMILAELFSQHKTLLILDGLEPMQYPPGELQGRLKDQSLIALLKNLAFNLKGLCVITSRVAVFELQSVCPSYPLEQLSTEAGMQVLENNQVTGPKAEMAKAVAEVKGHALTLALLGSYLKTVYQGDISKRDLMPAYTGKQPQGRHAKKVMAAYHHWLNDNNSPELDILHILGLFDRPATMTAIDILKTAPAIAGVSERVQNLNLEDWAFAVANLEDLSLITTTEQNQTLDCHPLVREYFTEQLKGHNPTGYQTAHARLYEYYKNLPEKELPDTLEELEPLFTAVAHGCLGGLHQQALEEVYWPRIQRKQENYIIRKLGAFASDLACISCFFERPWDRPAEGLTAEVKAAVLNWAASRLRGLGRLAEAVAPFEASIAMSKQQENWQSAASAASSTSELYLTLGKLAKARQFGEQSVGYADDSGDDFEKMSDRTAWADALLQSGQQQQAHELFSAAEAIGQQYQPEYPLLYSLPGFRFCALLLDIVEDMAQDLAPVNQLIQRAEQTLVIAQRNNWLLDIALDQLTLGKAHLLSALIQQSTDFAPAQQYLNQAVAGLRAAGGQGDLPFGLLARAALYRQQNDHHNAWADLDEVFESASYSQMLLHLTDYHLEACRNIRQQLKSRKTEFVIIERGQTLLPADPLQMDHNRELMTERFNRHLAEAAKLINKTGYHRRDKALKQLQNPKLHQTVFIS